jgi:hypothetical protein
MQARGPINTQLKDTRGTAATLRMFSSGLQSMIASPTSRTGVPAFSLASPLSPQQSVQLKSHVSQRNIVPNAASPPVQFSPRHRQRLAVAREQSSVIVQPNAAILKAHVMVSPGTHVNAYPPSPALAEPKATTSPVVSPGYLNSTTSPQATVASSFWSSQYPKHQPSGSLSISLL